MRESSNTLCLWEHTSGHFLILEEPLISYSVFSTKFFRQCSVSLSSPNPFHLCLSRWGVIIGLNYFIIRDWKISLLVYALPYTWLVSQKGNKSLHLPLGLSFQKKVSSWWAVFSTNEDISIFIVVQSSDCLFPDTETEGWLSEDSTELCVTV